MSVPLLPYQTKYENAGLILRRPSDLVPRGQYIILKNLFSAQEGSLRPRFPGPQCTGSLRSSRC